MTALLNRREVVYRAWVKPIQGRIAGAARAMAGDLPADMFRTCSDTSSAMFRPLEQGAFLFHTVGAHSGADMARRASETVRNGARTGSAQLARILVSVRKWAFAVSQMDICDLSNGHLEHVKYPFAPHVVRGATCARPVAGAQGQLLARNPGVACSLEHRYFAAGFYTGDIPRRGPLRYSAACLYTSAIIDIPRPVYIQPRCCILSGLLIYRAALVYYRPLFYTIFAAV